MGLGLMVGATDWEREIHDRLLQGDPVAPPELANRYFGEMCLAVRQAFPKETDDDLIVDAASEALIDYIKRPSQYEPSLRTLRGFLVMAAEQDYRNLANKRRRLRLHEIPATDVEDSDSSRNKDLQASQEGREPSPGVGLVDRESESEYAHFLSTNFPDPQDRLGLVRN